ncbi:hypothetical protein ACIUXQ_32895 [Pseudomonas aeruginosa]
MSEVCAKHVKTPAFIYGACIGCELEGLRSEAQALREEVAALKHSQQVLIGSRNAHRDERDAARKEVAELRRDKARLDAIEDNCWDVRYGISSNADAGDSSISIEIVGRYQGVPHIRVLGENYTENLRALLNQDKENGNG